MSSLEDKINKDYAEESAGLPKNRRMNGICVQHKKRQATVFFYIKGAKYVQVAPKFENKIREIFDKRVLDEALNQCDFAETIIGNDNCCEIVEWSTSLRLRQAILKYGLIKRAMRVKISKKLQTEYVFHVLLEEYKC